MRKVQFDTLATAAKATAPILIRKAANRVFGVAAMARNQPTEKPHDPRAGRCGGGVFVVQGHP